VTKLLDEAGLRQTFALVFVSSMPATAARCRCLRAKSIDALDRLTNRWLGKWSAAMPRAAHEKVEAANGAER